MHGTVVDAQGRPVEGAAVSTGGVVTTTDANGRFTLSRQNRWGSFVVLSRPVGQTARPWWRRVSELDDGAELQFVLEPEPQSLPYEFVQLTDLHMTTPELVASGRDDFGLYQEGALPAQIETFLQSLPERAPEAQALLITGDLVDHGLPEQYDAILPLLADSPLPTFVIPGNHDHLSGLHGSVISANEYLSSAGSPERWEAMVGPRWYSFDLPGLHVVAMDWMTYELGIDTDVQTAWVTADLALQDDRRPYILLFHDQPDRSLLDQLPWQPVATFSGHWHTSRVVQLDQTLHVNSPSSFFAGLDYSPPAFRRVTWDGEKITLRTETLLERDPSAALAGLDTATFTPTATRSEGDGILWHAHSAGAGHRQPVTVQGATVYVGAQFEDRPVGFVEAFDLDTGELRWRTETRSAIKTSPAVAGGVAIAAEVGGDLLALDAVTGDLRWRLASSDPYRRFAWGPPTIAGETVYVGDQADLRAVDLQTGEVIWRRTDLSPHHNLPVHAAPLIVGELLVIGFWPTPSDPVGLDIHTGEDIWARTPIDRDHPLSSLKALLMMGTATYDPARDAILMPAHGHTEALDRATGALRWAARHDGGFSPATPLVTDRGYIVTVAGHGIRMIDPADGALLWDAPVVGDAPFPMAAYTKAPHPVLAPPVLAGDDLLLPGLDGTVRRFDLDAQHVGSVQLGAPIAAALAIGAGRPIAIDTTGTITALDTKTIADI